MIYFNLAATSASVDRIPNELMTTLMTVIRKTRMVMMSLIEDLSYCPNKFYIYYQATQVHYDYIQDGILS
jgi:hypothetical protein